MAVYGPEKIAGLLKISRQWLGQLIKEGHLPRPEKRGEYDLETYVQAFLDYKDKLLEGRGETLTEKKLRGEDLDNELKEEKLKILKKEHINAMAVLEVWQRYIRNCLTSLMSMCASLAPDLVLIDKAPAIKKILEDRVHDAANELKRFKLSDIRIDESSLDVETSAKVKSKRVGGKKRIPKSRVKRKSG